MKLLIWKFVFLSFFLSGNLVLAQENSTAGTGLYEFSLKQQQQSQSFLKRDHERKLVGEIITRPTVVQGIGSTVVVGNRVYVPGAITDYGHGSHTSMLDVRCPLLGSGRVIISGNNVINDGSIRNFRGAGASMVHIQCMPLGRRHVRVERNTLHNRGTISSD